MDIISLNRCPQLAPVLAHWAYFQWYKNRSINFDLVLKSYQKISQSISLPLAYVAVEDTLPVGMATLKKNDLLSRKDLLPWLSALYVHPQYRGMGIGEKLITEIIVKSKSLGYRRLYLFLDSSSEIDLEDYYYEMGWAFLDSSLDNDGNSTKILYFITG